MPENPFVYGEIVPARGVRRPATTELDRLAADLADCQKIFLISPRRYGKSSLVRQALAQPRARPGRDARNHRQQLQLVRRVSRGLYARRARARSTRAAAPGPDLAPRAVHWRQARTARRRRRPGPVGRVSQRPHRARRGAAGRGGLRPAGADRARLNRRLAIALDEFQAIGSFNGGSVEQALRAAVQQQRQVGYVFAGSEPSADGADDRPAPALLQGRAGHAARQDPRRPLRRVRRRPLQAIRLRARSRVRRRRSSISPAICPTTSSASRTRPGTMCSARARRQRRPRRSPRDAAPAAGRTATRSSRRSGSA